MSLIKKIGLAALAALAVLVLLFIFVPVVAWILVGLVLLILALVLFVPIGADVAYIGGEFSLAARVDGLKLQLIPRKPGGEKKKEEKPAPPKEEKPKEPGAEKPKKSLNLDFTKEELFELIQKVLNSLGKFGKLTMRRFLLHYTAAGEDPYNTAMTYNYVNAAMSVLAPVCARKFRVTGDVDVWTDVDFTTDKMRLDLALSITLRLAQLVHVGLAAAAGALGVLLRRRKRLKAEAREAKKQLPAPETEDENKENNDIDTAQAEERKDTHG